jgi:hypothetical protein
MSKHRSTELSLLNEALSRARMLEPHDEAPRPSREGARRVAMQARAQQAHDLGDLSQFRL